MPLIPPSKQTLSRYGLSMEEWQVYADEQKHACFICEKEPKKGRLCIDHYHVKGWKKMPPERRKLYVRALLCFMCNTQVLGRCVTIEKLKRATMLLERFKERMPSDSK